MLPLPVPASVYGLVLLLAALNFGFVKLDDVKEVGIYLTGIAIIPVTVLVMVSAGRTTQAMTGRKKKEADHAE